MHRDFSLHSGERQVGPTLDQIREDHLARYFLAVATFQSHLQTTPSLILDIFCGNGYGTHILAKAFPDTLCLGLDASAEAIEEANTHYSQPNTLFSVKCFPFLIPPQCADAVVSFESIEHVDEDRSMMETLLQAVRSNGMAMISVPNETRHSLAKNPHKFHYRHYSDCDLRALISNEFIIFEKHGQDVYCFDDGGLNTLELLPRVRMNPSLNHEGQVSIYTLKRCG
jgi:SAM-dependent methyltransferase